MRRTFTVHYVRDGRSSHYHTEGLNVLDVVNRMSLTSVKRDEVVCIIDDDCDIEVVGKEPTISAEEFEKLNL